jgi:membrane-bound serine protease (ClpP class)
MRSQGAPPEPRVRHRSADTSAAVSRFSGPEVLRLIGLLFALAALMPAIAGAQTESSQPPVYVVSITGTIDLGLAPYLERVLDEAEDAQASAVILEIDTPGGRLDAVLQMKDALLDANVPTVAFVNRTAFSAGALIAIACESIYMQPGAVMGAATPVDSGGDTASEKVISAVRKTFNSTAEVRGRDPAVAEAMVDPDVVIDGLVGPGELLTLTTTEALARDYADGIAESRQELLQTLGLADHPIVETTPGIAERFVRFITDPVVASLLITAAILLIIADGLVGGFGVVGAVGLGLFAAFFWGHSIAGLAGWEDIALVSIGLVLIGIEVFLIPGFGVAGILGLAAVGAGLWLAMIGRIRTPEATERAGWSVAIAMTLVIAGTIAMLAFLPNARRLGGLVLRDEGAQSGPAQRAPKAWLRWFGAGSVLERDPTQKPPDEP